MNSIDKKDLIQIIKDIQTSRKIKDKHINFLLQKIADLRMQDKLIKVIK